MTDEKKNEKLDKVTEAESDNDERADVAPVEESATEEPATEEPTAEIEDVEEKEEAAEESAEALTERIEALEAQVLKLEQQAQEYKVGWQRSQASFVNYRNRMETDKETWRRRATADLLKEFLPVLDDFERAFQALPAVLERLSWLDGIRLIERKVRNVLNAVGVEPIPVEPGAPFDPQVHQAVMQQSLAGFEADQIIAEVQKGYMLDNLVLRPSLVVVATEPPVIEEEKQEEAEQATDATASTSETDSQTEEEA